MAVNEDRLAGLQTKFRARQRALKRCPHDPQNLPALCPEAGPPGSAGGCSPGGGAARGGVRWRWVPRCLWCPSTAGLWVLLQHRRVRTLRAASGTTGVDRNPSCLFVIFQKNNKDPVFADPRCAPCGGAEGSGCPPPPCGTPRAPAPHTAPALLPALARPGATVWLPEE